VRLLYFFFGSCLALANPPVIPSLDLLYLAGRGVFVFNEVVATIRMSAVKPYS
jgi:hypothetical protein